MGALRPRPGLNWPHREAEGWPEPPSLPPLLRLPLRHSLLDESDSLVRPGQRVRAGQILSRPRGVAAVPLRAPLSGVVRRVDILPVLAPSWRDGAPPGPRPVPCVELEALEEGPPDPPGDWSRLERVTLREALATWGLDDAQGLPLGLALDLLPGEGRLLLLGTASAQALQDALLERESELLAQAVAALCRAHPFRDASLVGPPGHGSAHRRLESLLGQVLPSRVLIPRLGHPWDQPRLAARAAGLPLPSPRRPLASQGLLALRLDQLHRLGQVLALGGTPPLVLQVDHLKDSAGLPRPLESRLLQVWPGTRLADLPGLGLEEGSWLLDGLPLEGSPWLEDDLPLLPGHVLLSRLPRLEGKRGEEACIHCGQCLDICPVQVAPIRLVRLAGESRLAEAAALGLEHCVHCGLCSWTCPSGVELEDGLRRARHQLGRGRHGA
jgi:electron transport complex protein RnfC